MAGTARPTSRIHNLAQAHGEARMTLHPSREKAANASEGKTEKAGPVGGHAGPIATGNGCGRSCRHRPPVFRRRPPCRRGRREPGASPATPETRGAPFIIPDHRREEDFLCNCPPGVVRRGLRRRTGGPLHPNRRRLALTRPWPPCRSAPRRSARRPPDGHGCRHRAGSSSSAGISRLRPCGRPPPPPAPRRG